MTMPTFYGAKRSNGDLVVIRKEDVPEHLTPERALGPETYRLDAPDSERARSMLAARRAERRDKRFNE
jgi:hypothetical protein